MDKKQIEQEAKGIIDKFSKALGKIDSKDNNVYVDREEFERIEGETGKSCEGFKDKLLSNAPDKDSDFVIAEKGAWKK